MNVWWRGLFGVAVIGGVVVGMREYLKRNDLEALRACSLAGCATLALNPPFVNRHDRKYQQVFEQDCAKNPNIKIMTVDGDLLRRLQNDSTWQKQGCVETIDASSESIKELNAMMKKN